MQKFILLLLLSIFVSCSNDFSNRRAFLKIERYIVDKKCVNFCKNNSTMSATASSFIFKHKKDVSYLLTAGHVCLPAPNYNKKLFKEHFLAVSLDGNYYSVVVKRISQKYDLCLLKTSRINLPVMEISTNPADTSEEITNIAATQGVFGENMVMYYDGRYSGESEDAAIYSIPAAGGSSGSPILRKDGTVIGVVSAVNRNFNHITISPKLFQIRLFLEGLL